MNTIFETQLLGDLRGLVGVSAAVGLLGSLFFQGQIILKEKEENHAEASELELDAETTTIVGNRLLVVGISLWIYLVLGVVFAATLRVLLFCLTPLVAGGLMITLLSGRETLYRLNKRATEIRKLAIVDLILFVTLISIAFSWRNPALSAVTAYLGVGVTMFCAVKVFIVLWRYKPQQQVENRIRLGLFLGYLYLIFGLLLIYIG